MKKLLFNNWICCSCIGLFALLLWGPTLRYNFVYDDDILVSQNLSIRSASNIPRFFWRRDLQSSEALPSSYRPVRNAVYTAVYVLDGKKTPRPWAFHLDNVLWHVLASMLLFQVALLLWERLEGGATTSTRVAALLLAVGFAAHPVLSEDVCYVKCLDDLLAGVFVLASAVSLLKWKGGWLRYGAALGWFLLAAFSKESAAPFAIVVFFVLLGFHRMPWRRSLTLTIPFLFAAFFYAAVRHLIMGRTTQYVPISGSYGQTLIDMFPVATEYLRLLCGIPPFCADYNYMISQPPYPFLSGSVMGGLFLAVMTCGMSVWLWFKAGWRMVGFGLGWIALFMLPISNLLPMMQYMAERFLYLPLMGFLFVLAGAFLKFSKPRVAAFAAVGIVALWTSASLQRMGVWRDDLTLFVQTELDFPGSPRMNQNALSAIFNLPQMMPLFPDFSTTGSWRMAKSLTPDQAGPIIDTLQQARRLFPKIDTFTTYLAFVDAKTGQLPQALVMAKLAARQNPTSATNQYNLAGFYLATGDPTNARISCEEALRLQPNYSDAEALQARIENQLQTDKAPMSPGPR